MGNKQAMQNSGPNFPPGLQCRLRVTMQTRDDSGLYDFDQSGVTTTMSLKNEGWLIRNGQLLQYSENVDHQSEEQTQRLARVVQTSEGLFVRNVGSDGSSENDLWYVLRKSDTKQPPIDVGDQFKLGRIRLRVNQLSTTAPLVPKVSNMQKYASVRDFQSVQCCRVCLSVEGESPLIRPCLCDGSVAYIHVHCLREWFKNKVQAQKVDGAQQVVYYAWKNLECEICKKQYQYNFEVDGLKFELFDMVKPQGPYIMFESLTKDRNSLKGLYVVDMSRKSTIRIGRGQDIDMRLLDISVSRVHTLLHFQRGNFHIQDAGSKFGTLALVKESMLLCATQQFQVAQSLLSFDTQCRKENVLQCFGSPGLKHKRRTPPTQQFERINQSSPMYSMNDESLMSIEERKQQQQPIQNDQDQPRNQNLEPPQQLLSPILIPKERNHMHSSVQFEVSGLAQESLISTTEQPSPTKSLCKPHNMIGRQQSQQEGPHKVVLDARSKSDALEAEDYCEQYLKQSLAEIAEISDIL